MSTSNFRFFALLAFSPVLGACPSSDDDEPEVVPVLNPEPAGAPTGIAEGRLGCLGKNVPPAPEGGNLTLPGWVRSYADREALRGAPTEGRVEAFDDNGVSVGVGFSDIASGRVAVSVPVTESGFTGWVRVTADGYRDLLFRSSRPVTSTAAAGWSFLLTEDEIQTLATAADVEIEPNTGILVGAVHDCDVFGSGGAVVTYGPASSGVIYLDGFDVDASATYTGESGRFAIPNVPPGTVTVSAWGRAEAGGPLSLLSTVDVEVEAGLITAVDLEPRMGATR